MKYIYGPVKSRRLGLSLGIGLTPFKICSFNCVYCQLGGTKELTCERKEYVSLQELLSELRTWLINNSQELKNLNYITFSGAGEPTLNIKIGNLITEIKKITNVPIAVITNASLLNLPSVRQDLLGADLIVPSLDAVAPEVFIKIDRPQKDIKLEDIINGLVNLRKEFPGKIWLEVMLVKGINDDLRHINRLKGVIDKINPDKVQINSPIRLTSGNNISPVEKNKLIKIREILGENCEII